MGNPSNPLRDDRVFTIMDTLSDRTHYNTSQGVLTTDRNGDLRTTNAELAAEIKETVPGALVVEHEKPVGGQGKRGGGKMGGSMVIAPSVGIFADKKYWFELRDEPKKDEDTHAA